MGGIVHDRSVSAVCAGAVFLWMFCAVQPVKAEPPFAGLEDRLIVLESILGTIIDQYCEDGSAVTGINSDGTVKCTELASEEQDFKYVFLSSAQYRGDLGGVAGADLKCQSLAAAAGLPGVYKAWLSDDAVSPSTRFDLSNPEVPYVLPDNVTVVADGWEGLVSGALSHSINQDENGTILNELYAFRVWTNTTPSGIPITTTDIEAGMCDRWRVSEFAVRENDGSTTVYYGWVGRYDMNTTDWTENIAIGCDNWNRLYCFQQ